MAPATPESGILEHSSALAESWETQLTSGPDPLEITGMVAVCMWVKPRSESQQGQVTSWAQDTSLSAIVTPSRDFGSVDPNNPVLV